jgi:chromosome segregation ATPase
LRHRISAETAEVTDALETRVRDLEMQRIAAQHERARLAEAVSAKEATINELTHELESLRASNVELQELYDDMYRVSLEADPESRRLREQLAHASAEAAGHVELIERLETELLEVHESEGKLREMLATSRDGERLVGEIQEQNRFILELEKEISSLQHQNQVGEDGATSKVTALEHEIHELTRRLDAASGARVQETEALNHKIALLSQSHSEGKVVAALEREVQQLQARLADTESEARELKSQLARSDAALQEARTQLALSERDAHELHDKLTRASLSVSASRAWSC